MGNFWSYVILAAGLLIAAGLASVAVRLVRVDKIEAKKSAARTPTLRDALFGRARISDDFLPDARIRGGMIYNRKQKRIEISGRLSKESFDRVFR